MVTLLLLLILGPSSCLLAPSLLAGANRPAQSTEEWPTAGWARATPASQGLAPDRFDALETDARAGAFGYTDRVLVVRNGRLVVDIKIDQDYRAISKGRKSPIGCGYGCDDPAWMHEFNYLHPDFHPFFKGREVHSLQSVTKSIAATVIGMALGQSRIGTLDRPFLDFFKDKDLSRVDARLRKATMRDLLTMRSGIEWHEQDRPLDDTNTTIQLERSKDWIQFTLDQPMDSDPGTKWAYNSGGSHLQAGIIRSATGRHIDDYAREFLFEPLGIRDWYWKKSPTGFPDSEGGLYLRAEDLAKIGYLYLKDGVWNGRRILPAGWVTDATTPHARVNATWNYGFQWWLTSRDGVDIWAGRGFGGQLLFVIPSKQTVAVVNAWNVFGAKAKDISGTLLELLTSDGAGAQTPAVAASGYAKILSSTYKADQPGAAALVAKGGDIVFIGAAGMADLELKVPLGADMVFEIGSITKQFTAAAIMLLAEEGKLSVSDPITKHLPSYPSYGQGITIEHLLTHTSGIVSYTGIPGYMATKVRNDLTVQQLIDVFKDLPVEFAPGERYAYNNSGYVLLGAIVEAASGMRYEDFVRNRIFEPLGMKTAYYGCATCLIPRRASGYDGGPNGFTNQRYLSFTQPYAAGSLMMTVSDLHRWARALFGGKVVSAASLERMTTPYVLKSGMPTTYGYGLQVGTLRGRRVIRHGGGIFGFSTDALYLPDQDVFVAVFSNAAGGGVGPGLPATRLAALAIGDPFPEFTAVTLSEDVLRRYVGVYEVSKEARRTVTLRDGALYTQRTGGPLTRATPASPTRFFYETSLSYFDFVVEAGRVTAMVMYQDGAAQGERAVRVAEKQ